MTLYNLYLWSMIERVWKYHILKTLDEEMHTKGCVCESKGSELYTHTRYSRNNKDSDRPNKKTQTKTSQHYSFYHKYHMDWPETKF